MKRCGGKKILLVASSFERVSLMTANLRRKEGVKTDDDSHYPLGLAYLHSYLESKGHEVATLFLNNYSYRDCFKKFKNEITNSSWDFVGFQILTANRVSCYKLIEFVHNKYPDKKIILGGIHASIMYKQLVERFPYIVAVIGEGEVTASELINELSKKKPDLEKINGIAYSNNGNFIKTKDRELIADLDELPFPKHEIFFENRNRKRGNILTMRGCPFKCNFCCLDLISRGMVRKRSAKNVISEIVYMIKKFPQMDTIWIHDDSFLLDNQRVINLCKGIIRRKVKIKFICSARVRPLSKYLIKMMEKANFELVLLGVESGSDKILKSCHKGITKSDILKAIRLFSDSKIMISIFLITGLPGETESTVAETANFVKTLQKIKYFYYGDDGAMLTVYPGTEIYEITKAKGLISDDFWLSSKPTPLFTVENSKKTLFRYKDFLLNNISLDRFFTCEGIKHQYSLLPSITRFMINNFGTIFKNRDIFKKKLLNIIYKNNFNKSL